MHGEPRVRVSAILRWQRGILLCRHDKRGHGGAWLLPGGGVRLGESLIDALEREMREEVGIAPPSFEGPVALVDSIAPPQIVEGRSVVQKHVVHVIFAGELDGSLEHAVSQDDAVSGHRLFSLGELETIVLHPPIGRFLARWRPGDPAVYLGAVWVP